jgi:hypothetical protein
LVSASFSVRQDCGIPSVCLFWSSQEEVTTLEIFSFKTDVAGLKDKVFTTELDTGISLFQPVKQTGQGDRSDSFSRHLIKELPTTCEDTMAEELSQEQATKILVEEFDSCRNLPTKYKFHVVNGGKVAAIDMVGGRNGDRPCYRICLPALSMRSE